MRLWRGGCTMSWPRSSTGCCAGRASGPPWKARERAHLEMASAALSPTHTMVLPSLWSLTSLGACRFDSSPQDDTQSKGEAGPSGQGGLLHETIEEADWPVETALGGAR